jgi:hypothetical protein
MVRSDGRIDGYDSAFLFDMTNHPVANLDALAELINKLLPRRNMCVVRGEIIDPAHSRGVRRLLHTDKITGDRPILRNVPRRWLALDMEGLALPAGVPAADIIACARLALATLPDEFSAAGCVVQASGSHGFKPDIRLRLWFWCDRPMAGAELKRWLRDTPADPAVFGAAQPIYTARPVLGDGLVDPVPHRLALLPGSPMVRAPAHEALAPPLRPATPPVVIHLAHVDHYARAALARAADRIMHASKRHPTIISECRGLARLVHARLLPEADLRAVVLKAAAVAGKDDAREIENCIAWGLENPSDGKVPEVRNA